MRGDVTRELNKIDAKPTGLRIGQQLEQGVGDGAKGAATQVRGTLSERLGTQVGSVVGKGIGAGLKLGMAGAAGAAAVALGGVGLALTKGFDRLKAIDQAKFKLQALGNDAATTAKIMDNALASVKGTAFGLQDAATAAASAVAAGIKPGQDLTKYLSEVGDAAAVAGTNFDDMGSIFNKIQTSNKAYTDDLQQLSDRGLPIFQWLQKEYGVTADKLSDMVQKGEVDSAHFQDAISQNIGGAAQKMGQSFDGAVDNMEASVARLGANFITAILGGDPANALAGPTEAIGALTTKFDDVGVWVNAHRDEIHGFFLDVKEVATDTAGAVKSIGTWLVENKGAAETLATVFVGWKVASTLGEAAVAARGIATALGLVGPAAATAGAEGAAGLAPLLAAIGPLAALPGFLVVGNNILKDAPPSAENARSRGTTAIAENQGRAPGPNIAGGGGANASRIRRGLAPYDPTKGLLPHAAGGAIFGAGSRTSDSIPALLSNGEHVWTADEVQKAGGQGAMYRMRAMVSRFSDGGAVTVDAVKQFASQISGGSYIRGGPAGATGTDCSGAQAWMANFLTGGSGRFGTANEGPALLSRGFQQGDPPAGISAYWVGWKNGGPGGGHTAGTIVDPTGGNVNVEMGGASGGGAYGGPAAGASSFPNRAWISIAGGEDPNATAGSSFSGAAVQSGSGGASFGGTSGSSGGASGQSLGQLIGSGLKESLSVPGFMDPFDTPNAKSAIAGLNFALGLLGGGDSSGGSSFGGDLITGALGGAGINLPNLSGLLSPVSPRATSPVDPNTSVHGQANGAGPGPTFNVTATGMDPKAVVDKQAHAYNQSYRRNMSAVRPG